MDLSRIKAFTSAMQRKDLEGMLHEMAEDVVLRTPLAPEPFRGKHALRPVVTALLRVVDRFEFREYLQGPEHVCAFFGLTVGNLELDGVDYWRLDESGFIQEMTVLWRPLPFILEVKSLLDAPRGPPG